MNNGGQNDWQNLGGGNWPPEAGGYNQSQGYGTPQPYSQNQPLNPAPNSNAPTPNYQPNPYAAPSGGDLSGGGQTYRGTMPPDTSYNGQPYVQPYNQGYNQPYNNGYNQANNQQYNQYGVPPVPSQWRRPLVLGVIGVGIVMLFLVLTLRVILGFGFHSFGYYGYGVPWWVPLVIIGGILLRVVLLFTRASYRSPISTAVSAIALIFTILILLIAFL